MRTTDTLDPVRRAGRDYTRARRHSTLVSLLRKVLPVAAVGIVLGFVSLAALSYNPFAALDIAGIGLDDGKLVMRQPKLEGFDRDDKPYLVTAERALQDLSNTDIIDLELVHAEMASGPGGGVQVEAGTGRYDSDAETLTLAGGVTVTSGDGVNIELQHADIDMKSGTLQTDKPVRVVSEDAEITADTLRVYDEGKRIVFSQRVRMTIERPTTSSSD